MVGSTQAPMYLMQDQSGIYNALGTLPIGRRMPIQTTEGEFVKGFGAIKVTQADGTSKFIAVPSVKYNPIQHETAFTPIINAVNSAGIPYDFVMNSNWKTANLWILTKDVITDGVRLGFTAKNSLDGKSAVQFGFKADRVEGGHIELVGYRQVCSNGMKIKVPLDQAEIVSEELVAKITEVMNLQERVLHFTGAEQKLDAIKGMAEALTMVREPVNKMIALAESWQIDDEKLKEFLEDNVKKRYRATVEAQYKRQIESGEGKATAWNFVNALTFVASHETGFKLNISARDRMLNKAADFLLEVVTRTV